MSNYERGLLRLRFITLFWILKFKWVNKCHVMSFHVSINVMLHMWCTYCRCLNVINVIPYGNKYWLTKLFLCCFREQLCRLRREPDRLNLVLHHEQRHRSGNHRLRQGHHRIGRHLLRMHLRRSRILWCLLSGQILIKEIWFISIRLFIVF